MRKLRVSFLDASGSKAVHSVHLKNGVTSEQLLAISALWKDRTQAASDCSVIEAEYYQKEVVLHPDIPTGGHDWGLSAVFFYTTADNGYIPVDIPIVRDEIFIDNRGVNGLYEVDKDNILVTIFNNVMLQFISDMIGRIPVQFYRGYGYYGYRTGIPPFWNR